MTHKATPAYSKDALASEAITRTQAQHAALYAAEMELEQQKRTILSRSSITQELTSLNKRQITTIDQTLQLLAHLRYHLENWLVAHSGAPKLRQRRRRRKRTTA